jgi:hypothetical protein
MAHFAKLNDQNVVTDVIVIANHDTSDASGVEKEYIGAAYCERLLGGRWVQTSYNGSFRKRFAGKGMIYNEDFNAFVRAKPHEGWTLNETTADWEAPIPMPEDGKFYVWDDATLNWIETNPPE